MPRQNSARDDVYTNPNLPPVIMTPHALPMFKDEDYRQTKRQRDKQSMTRKPEEPLKGAGKGGRVGSSATQHLVQHMFKNTMRDEDVSPGLLGGALYLTCWTATRGFAQVCGYRGGSNLHQRSVTRFAERLVLTRFAAWKENQPKPVFDNSGNTEKKDGQEK